MDLDGERLPGEAREAVRAHLAGENPDLRGGGHKAGVFVTINDPDGLRGCIGYPKAVMPLHEAVYRAAIAAATEDTRFMPLRPDELDNVRFEVTVLDEPVLIRAKSLKEYLDAILPGRDGLIVRRGGMSGLLLPQVATEYGWSALQLLQNTCRKAGLDADDWRHPETDVYRFGGRIFSE